MSAFDVLAMLNSANAATDARESKEKVQDFEARLEKIEKQLTEILSLLKKEWR